MAKQTNRTAGPVKPVWIVGDDRQQGTSGATAVYNEIITGEWLTIINNVRLDDDPTSVNSGIVNVDGFGGAWVLLDIDSTLTPTDITFTPQYTNDGGTTWWDFQEGVWASMVYDDTVTASGINKAFLLPLGGITQWRMSVTTNGTDATNYFDVTVITRSFK